MSRILNFEHVLDENSVKDVFGEMPMPANRLKPRTLMHGLDLLVKRDEVLAPPSDQISNIGRTKVVGGREPE